MSAEIESEIPILRPAWLHPTGSRVSALAVHEDGQSCVIGTDDGKVKILEGQTGRMVFQYEAVADVFGVTSVSFSVEENYVAAAFEDGMFRVFNYSNGIQELAEKTAELSDQSLQGELIFEKKFSRQMVEKVQWQRGTLKVFFIVGKACCFFDAEEKELVEFVEAESSITDFALVNFPQFGPVVLLTCYGHLKMYQVSSGRQVEDFQWMGSLINLNVCPNKKYIVCGTQEQTIHIWNIKTRKDFEMRGFPQKVKQSTFREDGLQMAHGSGEEIIVWDFSGQGPAGKRPTVLGPHESRVSEVHFQNQGGLLASAAVDGIILFWKSSQPDKPIAITGIRDQEITKFQWSPDDQSLFVGFATGYAVMIPVKDL